MKEKVKGKSYQSNAAMATCVYCFYLAEEQNAIQEWKKTTTKK